MERLNQQNADLEKVHLFCRKYKKALVITTSVTVLQLIFGWDAKFCIINLIWLLV